MYRYNTFVSISIFRNEFNQLMKTLDVSAEFQFFFSLSFFIVRCGPAIAVFFNIASRFFNI